MNLQLWVHLRPETVHFYGWRAHNVHSLKVEVYLKCKRAFKNRIFLLCRRRCAPFFLISMQKFKEKLQPRKIVWLQMQSVEALHTNVLAVCYDREWWRGKLSVLALQAQFIIANFNNAHVCAAPYFTFSFHRHKFSGKVYFEMNIEQTKRVTRRYSCSCCCSSSG